MDPARPVVFSHIVALESICTRTVQRLGNPVVVKIGTDQYPTRKYSEPRGDSVYTIKFYLPIWFHNPKQ
ncbi:unnamed protein product [Adineta ricciae]|uniref:Uncharacterized protein n=1 Tax=Adineta ricciae TaxID=249248 RepID=A0A815ITZ7_ADIRI|nr:unnamed protein product [Adineta ricciae]